MGRKSVRSSSKKQILFVVVIVVVIAASVLFYLWRDRKIFVKTTPTSATTIKHVVGPAIQAAPHSPSTDNSSNQGGVTSTASPSETIPPSSEWTSSSNGDITLQLPSANSTIQSGSDIAGLANVPNVGFILTDNSVGLIAQGTLSVVNGKFSGTLQFTPHSSSGTLQIYYPNPQTGGEEDIVNISVNFAQG